MIIENMTASSLFAHPLLAIVKQTEQNCDIFYCLITFHSKHTKPYKSGVTVFVFTTQINHINEGPEIYTPTPWREHTSVVV